MQTDPRIDEYIERAGEFAQPLLRHLRALWQQALPEGEEGIKWRMPHIMVDGKNVAGMAAFKAHCAMMIHAESSTAEGMGQLGKIASLADLPPDEEIVARLRQAGEAIRTSKRPKPKPKPAIPMPDDFKAALAANPAAATTFDGFAPSYRRDYLEWIVEAKRDSTRQRRIAQACEWLAEGKKRNWKYENC